MMNATFIMGIVLVIISGVILVVTGGYTLESCMEKEKRKKKFGIISICFGILLLLSALLIIPTIYQRWGMEKNLLLDQLRAENKKIVTGYIFLENVKMVRHRIKIHDGSDLTYWEIEE